MDTALTQIQVEPIKSRRSFFRRIYDSLMMVLTAISFALARLLTAGLVGLGAPNPITYVVVPVALVVITMAACYVPARRASLIDPLRALRWE